MLKKLPKVSVITITYNQEKYIRQTLESIVSQETRFDFEVIVADDCSTDKTPTIIQEYEKQYPKIFKAVLRKKNLGPWQNFTDAFKQAKGDYIALCEGDDFWTDKNKLQKQADFMEKHPDYTLCFHPVKVFFENGEEKDSVFPDKRSGFTVENLLQNNFIQTNSVMYRRRRTYEDLANDVMPGDWYLHLYHAQFGKIGFINQVMASYRRQPGGIWWDSFNNIDSIWRKYGVLHLNMYKEVLNLYQNDPKNKKIIITHINELLSTLIKVDKKYKDKILLEAINTFPGLLNNFVVDVKGKEIRAKESILKLNKEIDELKSQINNKEITINQRDKEIFNIKSSKFWKLRNKLAILVGKKPI